MILTPKETADKVVGMGIANTSMTSKNMFLLGIMGGIFVGIGFLAYFTIIQSASTLSIGLGKLLGASVFPVGIVLCILVGGGLYTGNNLLTLAYFNKKVELKDVFRNWSLMWSGNFVGSLLLAVLIFYLGTLSKTGIQESVINTVIGKTSIPFGKAIVSGFMCNALVTLAIWMSFASKTLNGKVLALWFPVMAFVLIGFEHCVANMFVLSIGHMLDPSLYSISDIFIKNLIPVTIGNTLSGALFIPLMYKMIYYSEENEKKAETKAEMAI